MFKDAEIPKPQEKDKSVFDWNSHQANYNKLSATEKEFYYWVNYSRTNPVKFFNEVIIPIITVYPQLKGENLESLKKDLYNVQPLPMMRLNDTLLGMSRQHANDITSNNSKPSHNSTNGTTFVDRFKANNLKNCGGENISYGAGETDPLFMLILLYLDLNVSDLGHRKALLNSNYSNTGIAINHYGNGNTFLVEDFACNQN